jgi:hypothetical protein
MIFMMNLSGNLRASKIPMLPRARASAHSEPNPRGPLRYPYSEPNPRGPLRIPPCATIPP